MQRRFFRLTWINILSNITVPLAGLVDTAMLGHLADIRFLAGVALASVLFDYIYWTFGFLRMGTTGTTAQAVGRGDGREVFLTLYRALLLGVTLGLGLLLLQMLVRECGFALLGGAAEVEAAGRQYFDARIWGAPATLCNFALVGWFLGREESRFVLGMTIVANAANITLNYLFIIVLQLAAQGAGLATMLSQYLMLAVGLVLLFSSGPLPRCSLSEVLNADRLKALFRLNRDILIRTLFLVTSFALFVNLSSWMGTAMLAANSILLRLLNVASYMIDGAAFAAESLAGIFRGQGDGKSLRRLVRLSLLSGLGFAALFLAVLFVAPRQILELLTSHADLVDLSLTYAPWLVPTLVFGSLAYMYDGIFLGLTEGRLLRNAMILSTLLVFIPLALTAAHLGRNHLLWAAMVSFMAARTFSLWLGQRRLRRCTLS